jgi:photosystem II stability/assembly factor-like uncharacterized protein
MTEQAAHLVDRVIPDVPVRQWVLSLPWALRYRAFAATVGGAVYRSRDGGASWKRAL